MNLQQIENNSQPDSFISLPNKEQKNEEVDNKVYDIVLVDIKNSGSPNVICVKENIYDPDLKYICISYRWGKLNEQQVETPDYTAHITSFHLEDLRILCKYILSEPDLCEIPYLWIDAISVDQLNKDKKKEIILKMNQIYQHATYILAVPDFHLSYLKKNTANMEIINLIKNKYYKTIYNEIFNNNEELDNNNTISDDINSSITTNTLQQQQIDNDDKYSFIQKLKNMNINEDAIKIIEELELENRNKEKEINELKMKMKEKNEFEVKMKNEEKKKIYQFLAYLIDDWSNRTWVISEYQIAKEKHIKLGTPLKYWFLSLSISEKLFFSYQFNNDDDGTQQMIINSNTLTYYEVNNSILFNQFLKSRFMQRSHLDMILNSNATRNEDRFNAILPSWDKYNHLIKNKNTISDWNITDMASVRLKLYDIMNDDDLWDKATLLNACRYGYEIILPTFASDYKKDNLKIIEKLNYNDVVYKCFQVDLLERMEVFGIKEAMKQLIDEYKMNSRSIWNENLTSIQFNSHHCYLSVKSKSYFITYTNPDDVEYYQYKLSLENDDVILQVFIPFFTSNLPGYIDKPYIYQQSSRIFLIGNIHKNKWVLDCDIPLSFKSEHFCTDDYTFNIY